MQRGFLPQAAAWLPVCMCVPALPFPRYMVDAADQEKIEASKNELHNLLDKPQLQGIPVRTCGSWWGRAGACREVGQGKGTESYAEEAKNAGHLQPLSAC